MYLLGKGFFRLFFHWCYNIRIIFYNLLVLRIKYSAIKKYGTLKVIDKEVSPIVTSSPYLEKQDHRR